MNKTKRVRPSSYFDKFDISGRWISGSSGSLIASWAGSSISFIFYGKFLSITSGPSTERKDSWNRGVQMLALSVGTNELAVVSDLSLSEFCDLPPGEIATLLDSKNGKPRELYVRIMLVDWASVFELEALTMDEDASISPPPKATFSKMLYIGDSISCAAYAQLEDDYNKPSRGCLDAFPYVAQRVLAQGQPSKVGSIDLISYPGWALVAPDEQEKGWGNPLGMEDKYFHVSPWNTDLYAQPQPEAEVIVIELGTNDQECHSTERFKASLHNFISKLLGTMPSLPRAIWIIPPFLDHEEETPLRQEVQRLCVALQAAFVERVSIQLCNIASDFNNADTIDGLHPSLAGHEKLGSRMADFIRARLVFDG